MLGARFNCRLSRGGSSRAGFLIVQHAKSATEKLHLLLLGFRLCMVAVDWEAGGEAFQGWAAGLGVLTTGNPKPSHSKSSLGPR